MTDRNDVKLPKTSVLMVSFRNYRLASLSGHVINFVKRVPILVPPHVYREAIIAGAELYTDELKADLEGATPVVTAPVVTEPVVVVEEVIEETQDPRESSIDDAIRLVLVRGDEDDFKTDGTPKAAAVIAETGALDPKPTAQEVAARYEVLQSDLGLAED